MISKRHQLTVLIILGMLLGIALGEYVFLNSEKTEALVFADRIKLFTTIFLRLVQMIIAPLVFSTLVSGIAKMGDLKAVGRVGGKSMLWFISASLISLLLGLG
jgi:Na+/H+-dicarboxylate symporter